jgi:hypothetical protein
VGDALDGVVPEMGNLLAGLWGERTGWIADAGVTAQCDPFQLGEAQETSEVVQQVDGRVPVLPGLEALVGSRAAIE